MKKIDMKFATQVSYSRYKRTSNWKIEKDGKYFICPSDKWYVENGILCYEEEGEIIYLADPAYYFSNVLGDEVTLGDIAEMM
ncbi:hypothetical protein [Vallitalea guaymasensis]|uniref:hypothetical protein n=1 Tax=Vallitalea guaymasensis TaxID=1185412 RepID=UPI000DE3506D|nr:hypothetical protein [Vallitalea guaymasensis]